MGSSIKPNEEDIEEKRKVYEKLFSKDNLPDEEPFNIDYQGDPVDDTVPGEEEIKKALFEMRNRKAPGATNISIKNIKTWYHLTYPKNGGEPDEDAAHNWHSIVELIKRCWEDGDIPDAFKLGILVIILKDDKGGTRGIGLLEVIHKLISQIINIRMSNTIVFCESVHGF